MQKLLATLIAGLLATSAYAQTTAGSPAIGQAVSGNNATAAGTSGSGLNKDGTANTTSSHQAIGQEAAGVNAAGQVVAPSTSVIGTTPEKREQTNAQATNTTPPHSASADAAATGGRGEPGSKAEQDINKANVHGVKVPPGARLKTNESVKKGREKHAEFQRESAAKAAGADQSR